ncbi:hypothetical protein OQZ33_00550 [Pedobacter sp. MC2016-05]|uniref:hypothetical protein n=1 Tax=Pedobacter sp. MC2016-05 TaxID=2994474 RepID=UPI002247066B|nr:hypothetical protein [Pedobacter sp. MC2016-05]MCX2472807.1 hypothetical protein [Pedobacter sp. MC2016-05]
MKSYLLHIVFFSLAIGNAVAQIGVDVILANNDVNYSGKNTAAKNNTDYLIQSWNKGAVRLSNGSIYRNIFLIYDIVNNRPIFKSDSGTPQMFKTPVSEFSLNIASEGKENVIRNFRSGYPALEGNNTSTFYEVLSNGKITFLKSIKVRTVDERASGAIYSVMQKQQINSYFFFANDKLISAKKDKKQIYAILENSKHKMLDEFIEKNHLKMKTDEDITKLIDYYNSL